MFFATFKGIGYLQIVEENRAGAGSPNLEATAISQGLEFPGFMNFRGVSRQTSKLFQKNIFELKKIKQNLKIYFINYFFCLTIIYVLNSLKNTA